MNMDIKSNMYKKAFSLCPSSVKIQIPFVFSLQGEKYSC